MKKKVILLYSGGWDGTFRLLQLCQYDIDIQPVYIIDEGRQSNPIERERISQIIQKARARFPANILDIRFYERRWILENCADEAIEKAFEHLREHYAVGIQYLWFALLGKHLGHEKMESGVVHQYHGKVEEAIETEASFAELRDDVLPVRYCVRPKDGKEDPASIVFADLILPIIKLTKEDEERIARENGWMDIMELSWFCHKPIKGQPCGLCGPCDDAMNTGMQWRMPKAAQVRYRFRKILIPLRKNVRKCKKAVRSIASKKES